LLTQIELLGEPPPHRPDEITPWPRWSMKPEPPTAKAAASATSPSPPRTSRLGGRVEQIHWQNSGGLPFEPH
jgi:hypothetical protein